jgi:hypothetical protein
LPGAACRLYPSCPARGGESPLWKEERESSAKFYTSLKMGDLLARLREVYEKSYRIEKSFRNDLTGVHRNE